MKFNKVFLDYVFVDVFDVNLEFFKYVGFFGIRVKKDCFFGFSIFEYFIILLEGMINEDDLLFEFCKKMIIFGVVVIWILMGFLYKIFLCCVVFNFFFDII